MNINEERTLLIKELQQVEDISLLRTIKAVLDYGLDREDFIDVELYNRELDVAQTRIDQGEYIPHEEAVKRITGWRKTGD